MYEDVGRDDCVVYVRDGTVKNPTLVLSFSSFLLGRGAAAWRCCTGKVILCFVG